MKIVTSYDLSAENLSLAHSIAPKASFVAATTDEDKVREIEDADAFFGFGIKPEMIGRARKTSLDPVEQRRRRECTVPGVT